MLHHRLRSAGNKKLIYVGGTTGTYTGTSNSSLSLTSLTGGIANSPAAGDLVVFAFTVDGFSNRDLSMNTPGYSELLDGYQADDALETAINIGIFFKKMTSTPDTTAVATRVSALNNRYAMVAHVWRNASSDTPNITTANGTSGNVNAPSITPTKEGSVILVIAGGSVSGTFSAPSGITLFQSTENVNDVAIGAYVSWVSGAYDPPQFSSTSIAWIASSVVITP